jgi:hypothetical protein
VLSAHASSYARNMCALSLPISVAHTQPKQTQGSWASRTAFAGKKVASSAMTALRARSSGVDDVQCDHCCQLVGPVCRLRDTISKGAGIASCSRAHPPKESLQRNLLHHIPDLFQGLVARGSDHRAHEGNSLLPILLGLQGVKR